MNDGAQLSLFSLDTLETPVSRDRAALAGIVEKVEAEDFDGCDDAEGVLS